MHFYKKNIKKRLHTFITTMKETAHTLKVCDLKTSWLVNAENAGLPHLLTQMLNIH